MSEPNFHPRRFVPPLGWPIKIRASLVTSADRHPLVALNRYPRQVIGVAFRLHGSVRSHCDGRNPLGGGLRDVVVGAGRGNPPTANFGASLMSESLRVEPDPTDPPTRVDSDTPEGRLWNWLAGQWESVTQQNTRQAARYMRIRDAARRVQALSEQSAIHDLMLVINPNWVPADDHGSLPEVDY